MKGFIVFCGDTYYPNGGWKDVLGVYGTLEEAKDSLLDYALTKSADWAHIADLETQKIIWNKEK